MVQETDSDIRVPQPELLEAVTSIFIATGMSEMDADILADSLVLAELEGVHSLRSVSGICVTASR